MQWITSNKLKFSRVIVSAIALSGVLLAYSCSTNAQDHNNHNQPTDSAKPVINHDHSKINLGPADNEYELRFIDGMIPHHEGAVTMAKDVLKKSKRPELRKLATAIIQAQNKESNLMKQWRKSWYPKASNTPIAWHSEMNHSMAMSEEQIKAMRMDIDLGKADNEYELRFINAMIPHHEGALIMAKDVLNKSKKPEMKKLAKNIISSQNKESNLMKQWRKSWYNQ